MAPNLSKKKIKGKETILWMNGSLFDKKNDPFKGKNVGIGCGWKLRGAWHPAWHECVINNFPTYLREKRTKEITKALDLEKSKMNIQRFKGLGEMNPEELWSTTLDPETRNLLQVQYSKDLKKDQSLIHTLMGNDVALRKDFIVSNAINVQNLDI